MTGSIKGAQLCIEKGDRTTPWRTIEQESKNRVEDLERKKSQREKQKVGKSVIVDMHQQANPFSPSKSLPSSKD